MGSLKKILSILAINCLLVVLIPEPSNAIQVMVSLKLGKLKNAGLIEIQPEAKILDLKQKAAQRLISEYLKTEPNEDWKNLIASDLSKEILEDSKTLKEYGMRDGSAVFLE